MLRFLPVIIKPLAVILFVSMLVVQWVKVDNSKYDDSDFISIVYQCSELNKYDFVAIDEKRKRICVRGLTDNFSAVKIKDKWSEGNPAFEDLMNSYSAVKEVSKVKEYSIEARQSIESLNNTK